MSTESNVVKHSCLKLFKQADLLVLCLVNFNSAKNVLALLASSASVIQGPIQIKMHPREATVASREGVVRARKAITFVALNKDMGDIIRNIKRTWKLGHMELAKQQNMK